MTERAPGALVLSGITRRFGPVTALRAAELQVRPGTVHALLGENGAGKTTLMRVAYGLVAPDSGAMHSYGRPLAPRSPRDALRAGIAMVQQHFSLVPAMTVAENVALGGSGRYDAGSVRDRVRELSRASGLAADPDALAADLPVSGQQRVEILKALARDVRVLVLDEPTAVLAPGDAAALLRWIREFAAGGRAVVLITHKLRDALAVADDVTVLRRGATVLQESASALTEGDVATAMLGEGAGRLAGVVAPEARLPGTPAAAGAAGIARLDDVSAGTAHGALHGVSLQVGAGEIVGVAAVEGNGERELMELLAGRLAPSRGTVALPARAGYIPADRHADAIADDLSIVENVALRDAGARRGWLSWGQLSERARTLVSRFSIHAPDPDAPVRSLSGGNQQRLVLARELDDAPRLLVADQPTRGLDVRATAEVHARLREAAEQGAAVVVHSADLDEVLALAHRVFVVVKGVVREVAGDRERIGRAMLGLHE